MPAHETSCLTDIESHAQLELSLQWWNRLLSNDPRCQSRRASAKGQTLLVGVDLVVLLARHEARCLRKNEWSGARPRQDLRLCHQPYKVQSCLFVVIRPSSHHVAAPANRGGSNVFYQRAETCRLSLRKAKKTL